MGSWERNTAFSLAFAREAFKKVSFELLRHLDVLVYQFKEVDCCLGVLAPLVLRHCRSIRLLKS